MSRRHEQRIAELEAQVAELQAALREWRPLAANKVPSECVDAHGIWRTTVEDYKSGDGYGWHQTTTRFDGYL